jgi:hypothetical protein
MQKNMSKFGTILLKINAWDLTAAFRYPETLLDIEFESVSPINTVTRNTTTLTKEYQQPMPKYNWYFYRRRLLHHEQVLP